MAVKESMLIGSDPNAAVITAMGWIDVNQAVTLANARFIRSYPPCYEGDTDRSANQIHYGGSCDGQ